MRVPHTSLKPPLSIIYLTLYLTLITPASPNDISKFFSDAECQKCECYRVKCSRLNDKQTCTDIFAASCDNRIDIREDEANCNAKCDCCINYKCFKWNDYKCIMYRSMYFCVLFYMFMSIIMFYALEKIARLMFSPGSYRPGMLAGQKNGDQEEAVSEINLKIERYLKREVSKFEGDPNLVKVTCRYNAVLHIRKFVKIEPKGERGLFLFGLGCC